MTPDPFSQLPQARLAPEDVVRRLRWRARRGLLENDLIMTRFFDQHAQTLTEADHDGLARLLDLTDNDLMALFLGQREPEDDLAIPEVVGVLQKIRAS